MNASISPLWAASTASAPKPNWWIKGPNWPDWRAALKTLRACEFRNHETPIGISIGTQNFRYNLGNTWANWGDCTVSRTKVVASPSPAWSEGGKKSRNWRIKSGLLKMGWSTSVLRPSDRSTDHEDKLPPSFNECARTVTNTWRFLCLTLGPRRKSSEGRIRYLNTREDLLQVSQIAQGRHGTRWKRSGWQINADVSSGTRRCWGCSSSRRGCSWTGLRGGPGGSTTGAASRASAPHGTAKRNCSGIRKFNKHLKLEKFTFQKAPIEMTTQTFLQHCQRAAWAVAGTWSSVNFADPAHYLRCRNNCQLPVPQIKNHYNKLLLTQITTTPSTLGTWCWGIVQVFIDLAAIGLVFVCFGLLYVSTR